MKKNYILYPSPDSQKYTSICSFIIKQNSLTLASMQQTEKQAPVCCLSHFKGKITRVTYAQLYRQLAVIYPTKFPFENFDNVSADCRPNLLCDCMCGVRPVRAGVGRQWRTSIALILQTAASIWPHWTFYCQSLTINHGPERSENLGVVAELCVTARVSARTIAAG